MSPARREYGPYTLALLHGERFIGRVDAAMDRRAGLLEVRRTWSERGAPREWHRLMRTSLEHLSGWLGADLGEVPRPAP